MFSTSLAAVLLLSGTASALAAASAASASDKKFMQEAYAGGYAEVVMGKLAEQKGSGSQTRLFGQRMVADHTQNGQQLAGVASAAGTNLAKTLPAEAKAEMAKLSKLSGAQFDRAYLSYEVTDHKNDIAKYQSEESATAYAPLKSYISSSLPTLNEHERLAETDAAMVGK